MQAFFVFGWVMYRRMLDIADLHFCCFVATLCCMTFSSVILSSTQCYVWELWAAVQCRLCMFCVQGKYPRVQLLGPCVPAILTCASRCDMVQSTFGTSA